jgi:hypothetical protein
MNFGEKRKKPEDRANGKDDDESLESGWHGDESSKEPETGTRFPVLLAVTSKERRGESSLSVEPHGFTAVVPLVSSA